MIQNRALINQLRQSAYSVFIIIYVIGVFGLFISYDALHYQLLLSLSLIFLIPATSVTPLYRIRDGVVFIIMLFFWLVWFVMFFFGITPYTRQFSMGLLVVIASICALVLKSREDKYDIEPLLKWVVIVSSLIAILNFLPHLLWHLKLIESLEVVWGVFNSLTVLMTIFLGIYVQVRYTPFKKKSQKKLLGLQKSDLFHPDDGDR